MNFHQRTIQRTISYQAGLVILGLGSLSFALIFILALLNIYFPKMTELGAIAMCASGFGVLLSLIFSQVGWSRLFLIDFLLNQLSLLLTLFGFIWLSSDLYKGQLDSSSLIGVLFIFFGLFLVSQGIKYSDLPSEG